MELRRLPSRDISGVIPVSQEAHNSNRFRGSFYPLSTRGTVERTPDIKSVPETGEQAEAPEFLLLPNQEIADIILPKNEDHVVINRPVAHQGVNK